MFSTCLRSPTCGQNTEARCTLSPTTDLLAASKCGVFSSSSQHWRFLFNRRFSQRSGHFSTLSALSEDELPELNMWWQATANRSLSKHDFYPQCHKSTFCTFLNKKNILNLAICPKHYFMMKLIDPNLRWQEHNWCLYFRYYSLIESIVFDQALVTPNSVQRERESVSMETMNIWSAAIQTEFAYFRRHSRQNDLFVETEKSTKTWTIISKFPMSSLRCSKLTQRYKI